MGQPVTKKKKSNPVILSRKILSYRELYRDIKANRSCVAGIYSCVKTQVGVA